MKSLRFVCLFAITLATGASCSMMAQSLSSMATANPPDHEMQRGVSVQMAATRNAQAMPAADDLDAWVVSVTDGGSLYFKTEPVTYDKLIEAMSIHPRNREQKLYIKADARTAYANVQRALASARATMFETAVLLTVQEDSQAVAGALAPPKGLVVGFGSAASQDASPGRRRSTVVEVFSSKQSWPLLKVNEERVPWDELSEVLGHLPTSAETIVVRAAGELPFSEVVHVIDACRSTGARVVLETDAAPLHL